MKVQQRFFASWEGLKRLEAAGEVAVQGELIGTEIQAPEIGDWSAEFSDRNA